MDVYRMSSAAPQDANTFSSPMMGWLPQPPMPMQPAATPAVLATAVSSDSVAVQQPQPERQQASVTTHHRQQHHYQHSKAHCLHNYTRAYRIGLRMGFFILFLYICASIIMLMLSTARHRHHFRTIWFVGSFAAACGAAWFACEESVRFHRAGRDWRQSWKIHPSAHSNSGNTTQTRDEWLGDLRGYLQDAQK